MVSLNLAWLGTVRFQSSDWGVRSLVTKGSVFPFSVKGFAPQIKFVFEQFLNSVYRNRKEWCYYVEWRIVIGVVRTVARQVSFQTPGDNRTTWMRYPHWPWRFHTLATFFVATTGEFISQLIVGYHPSTNTERERQSLCPRNYRHTPQ